MKKLTYEQILKYIEEAESVYEHKINEKMNQIIIRAREKGITWRKIHEWLTELGYRGTVSGLKDHYFRKLAKRQK